MYPRTVRVPRERCLVFTAVGGGPAGQPCEEASNAHNMKKLKGFPHTRVQKRVLSPSEDEYITAVPSRDAIQVWDLDYHEKGDFLGEVRLSKQDLAEKVPVDGTNEFTAVLQPKPDGSDGFNRLVQGSLRFTCQVGVFMTRP